MDNSQVINEIRSKVDIVDVISDTFVDILYMLF